MDLAVVGVNYNNTPIDIREKVSFSKSQKEKASKYLIDKGIEEIVILSTCNRSEIYMYGDKIEDNIKKIKKFYRKFFHVEDVDEYLFQKKGRDAVAHIYNVAVGFDSMILCEDQILGQVKEAMDFSIDNKFSGKVLNKLFREAITSAKSIKNRFKISETPISIVYIAIKLLKENIGNLRDKKACVIGIGDMGRLALTHLIDEGLDEIFVANRTYNNMLDLLVSFPQVKPVEFEKRYDVLKKVDILITATSAPHTIIDFKHMKNIKNEIYIMDLALPRDVEKNIDNLANIKLYDIDDFKSISDKNKRKREILSQSAEEIINLNVDEFIKWSKGIKVDSVIKNLNEKCSDIKEEYFNYIDKKLDLDKKEKKVIKKMMNSALKKVVKEPILNLKELTSDEEISEYIDVINKLFDF